MRPFWIRPCTSNGLARKARAISFVRDGKEYTWSARRVLANSFVSRAERLEKTTQIEKKSMDIEERGVKLRLTIVDTPGECMPGDVHAR